MTKKNWLLTLLLIVLTAIYAVYFTDWFKTKAIKIFHTYRAMHSRQMRTGAMQALIFGIDRKVSLSEIRVVPFDEFQTNKSVLPLWHLVTDSNSVPMKSFFYGEHIQGMKPAIRGTHPELLETNVQYLLIITAGRIKGEHPFELK